MVFPKETLEYASMVERRLQFDNLSPDSAPVRWRQCREIDNRCFLRPDFTSRVISRIRSDSEASIIQTARDRCPDLFGAPLSPGYGQAEFDVDWKPKRLGIALLTFVQGVTTTVKGETR